MNRSVTFFNKSLVSEKKDSHSLQKASYFMSVDRQGSFIFCAMQKDGALEVDGEMAAILQSSRFSLDFKVQILDKPRSSSERAPQVIMNLIMKI